MITPANFWFFFGGLWLAVGLLFAGVGAGVLWHDAAREGRLAREAIAGSGVVLSKSAAGGYRVEYRFQAGGAAHEGSVKVSAEAWQRLAEGGAVALRYIPAAPEVHALAGEARDAKVLGPIFAAVGALFALSGAAILWRAAVRRRFVAMLLTEGARADAEVIEVLPTNVRINREPQWAIRYRYQDYAGRRHEGRTPPMAQEAARAWRVGERGEVRYESARPHRSLWRGRA